MKNIVEGTEAKMRVLQIIPGFPTGGAEQVVLGYLRYFASVDEVDMECLSLSPSKGRLYERQIEEESLPVHFLRIKGNLISRRVKEIKAIRAYVTRFRPQVVHVHLSILWLVTVALIGLDVKIFHTLHNDPRVLTSGRHVLISRICYNCFGVKPIALNEHFADIARDLYHSSCYVLGNGIQLEKFRGVDRNAARRILGVDGHSFVVSHIGRFHIQKNHEKILRVFRACKNLNPDCLLLLVGSGELEEELRSKIEELGLVNDVWMLGNRSDVNVVLGASDSFLFPSKYEGLGIALVEAQAAGVKCVVSNTVPSETIVTDHVVVMDLSDSDEDWARAVLGNANMNAVAHKPLESYSIDSICKELIGLYER